MEGALKHSYSAALTRDFALYKGLRTKSMWGPDLRGPGPRDMVRAQSGWKKKKWQLTELEVLLSRGGQSWASSFRQELGQVVCMRPATLHN